MTLGDKIRALKSAPDAHLWPSLVDRAAALADEHEATIAAGLQDPVAVHTNMLRGSIAKPSWEQIMHLYPVEAKATIAAAYDDAAQKATSFLVGDPANGVPLRNPMAHEIADAIRADIAAAREADLRAALSKHRKVIAKAYRRVAAVVQSISDEGDRVYFGSSNDADMLRDLAREWDDARILKEDIRSSEDEVRDLRADRNRLRAEVERLGRDLNIARYGQPDFAWSIHKAAMADLNDEIIRLRALLDEARKGLSKIADGREPLIPHATRDLCIHGRNLDEECHNCIRAFARATLAKIGGQ